MSKEKRMTINILESVYNRLSRLSLGRETWGETLSRLADDAEELHLMRRMKGEKP